MKGTVLQLLLARAVASSMACLTGIQLLPPDSLRYVVRAMHLVSQIICQILHGCLVSFLKLLSWYVNNESGTVGSMTGTS